MAAARQVKGRDERRWIIRIVSFRFRTLNALRADPRAPAKLALRDKAPALG